ncbi:MAG: hypothetical protein HUJ31_11590 [Pseudomonadales bacterium]|nr:hypothetical protein [Pseudomonadales bacterium]
MKRRIPALMAAALLFACVGAAATELSDCPRPSAPQNLPEGSSSSESEMVEAQRMVKGFVSEGQAFLECLKTVIQEVKENVEEAQGGEDLTEEQTAAVRRHQKLIELHNEMVGEMQRVAEKFNQALHDYNAKEE